MNSQINIIVLFFKLFGCWIIVFNTSCVFHAFIDCTAATRVRGAVSQSSP